MIQVSFVAYWIGGAFLSLAYWDYPYILVALLVLTWAVVKKGLRPQTAAARRAVTIAPARLAKEGPRSSGTL